MEWKLLGTADSKEWRLALNRFPETDIYFFPEFHRAYEVNGDGLARLFLATEGDEIFIYPFFVRSIDNEISRRVEGDWYDIETVHGYSGPLSTTGEPEFLKRAWSVFSDWANEQRVVAEFVRFNPSLENTRYADPASRVWADRQMVVVNLDGSAEQLWTSYGSLQRNRVRKAIKEGLECERLSSLEARNEFRRLHNLTMERNAANSSFLFSDAYFEFLWSALAENLELFVVRYQSMIVASALYLSYGQKLHYHFGNSDSQYNKYAPNNLLMHTVAEWGIEHGFKQMYLGGGRTTSPDDDLLRFKLVISRDVVPYWLGRRIHNRRAYDALCEAWLQQTGNSELPAHSFPYRLS